MAITTTPFVIKHYDGFGGNFVNSQYLSNSYNTAKPHVFENTLMKIYSSKTRFFTGKPLIGMTGAKMGGIKEIPVEVYRWTLQGAEEKTARSMENLEAGNATPGVQGQSFRIKLDLDYYASPDVLFGMDNEYPLAIQSGPVQDGSGFIYTVKIQGDDPNVYFPTEYLEVGSEFNKVWTSTASEYNKKFGTQQAPNSFKLENQIGMFAQKLSVTDRAMREEGRIEVEFLYTDPRTGKESKISRFMPMYEARMNDELYMSMEAQLTYGKKQTVAGDDGYWIKTGPGLRQQMKDSWVEYFNGALTTTKLRDYLMSIFFSREDEQNRKVVGMTGTLGSLMFHDMLASEASSFLTVDTNFTQKLSSKPRHLSFGAQFTHYQGPEGVEVTVTKNPMNDSRRYQKQMHPQYPDIPIDSARFTFLDFGSAGKEDNISMLKLKDSFRHGYTVGTVGPNGPVQGGQAGALIAGYDIFTEGSAGLWIKDITRGGELIFDADY